MKTPLASVARPFSRPGVVSPRPNRSLGGLYRSAEHEERGHTFGGVPLQTAEDAVVAAVRMGYRVADEQIERGRRVASRLRGAMERDGSEGLGDAVDGVEQLVTKLLQNGLQFVEQVARDPQNPLKRLASAELSLVASMLGVRSPTAAPTAAPTGAPPAATGPATPPAPDAVPVAVQHDDLSDERAVKVTWRARVEPGYGRQLTFHHLSQGGASMKAWLEHGERGLVLRVTTSKEHPTGRWRAAVLDEHRVQLGFVEIEL